MPRGVSSKTARHCHVYLVQAADAVKIGRSSRLQTRVAEIQVGSAVRVTLAHSWKLKKAEAPAFEGALHKLFRWARSSGEWHKVSVEQIKCVGDMHLAGDADGAAALSSAMREEAALWVAREAAGERIEALRWRPANDPDKLAAYDARDEAHERWKAASRRKRELGYVTEWDEVLDEAVGRASERIVPRRSSTPAPREQPRQWPKAKGSYGGKAALAAYKEARGIQ